MSTLKTAHQNFVKGRLEIVQAIGNYIIAKKKEIGEQEAMELYRTKWDGKLKLAYFGVLKNFNDGASGCNFSGNMQAEKAVVTLNELASTLNSDATNGAVISLGDLQNHTRSESKTESLPFRPEAVKKPGNTYKPQLPYRNLNPGNQTKNALLNGLTRKDIAWARCRKKYGEKLSKVTFKDNKIICHYMLSKKKRLKIAWKQCRKKWGKRLSRVSLNKTGYICHYKRSYKQRLKEARRRCRKKWGKKYIKTTLKGNRITCHYRSYRSKKSRMRSAIRRCRKKYGRRLTKVRIKGNRIICHYRR